jgi:dihydrofolate reductase
MIASDHHILRQVSVAMTPDGVIGDGPDLLFKSRLDLAEFAEFTKKTVLVVGRHTAQQLIEHKVYPTEDRPFLVISEGGIVTGGPFSVGKAADDFAKCERWLLYAKDLKEGLKLAESYTSCFNLAGYTVIGGKRVYDDLFKLVSDGKTRLNRAYIFTADSAEIAPLKPVKLSMNYTELFTMLRSKFVDPSFGILQTNGNLNISHKTATSSSRAVRGAASVTFVNDDDVIDTKYAHLMKTHLKVRTTTGEYHFLRSEILGWHPMRGSEVVELFLKNGTTFQLRMKNPPQLDWLVATLKRL